MEKLTKEQREIKKIFGNLPEQYFWEIAKTQEQINALSFSNIDYFLIAECWESLHSFSPMPESLRKIPKDQIEYIQKTTSWFNAIWDLVWDTFPYIKQHFKKRNGFELHCKNEIEFFKNLATRYANNGIKPYFLPGYKEFPHSKMQKAFKLCKKAGEQKLKHAEIKQIDAILNGLPNNYWLAIAMAAWGESKNKIIESKVKTIVLISGEICELTRKKTAKDRSFALVNGEKIYPSGSHGRNGYKLS